MLVHYIIHVNVWERAEARGAPSTGFFACLTDDSSNYIEVSSEYLNVAISN